VGVRKENPILVLGCNFEFLKREFINRSFSGTEIYNLTATRKGRRQMVAKLFLLVAVRRHSKGQSEADKKWRMSLDYISVKEDGALYKRAWPTGLSTYRPSYLTH
jgi:ATP-dependent helicase/DNAse subunit B